MASDFFLQVWLTYLLCLNKYFRINFDEQTRARARAEHASLRDLSLGNILFRNKTVPSLSFHAATQLPLLETETCVSAILNDVFRHDAYATRINRLLPALQDWSFQERWPANPLLVGDDARKFAMVVEGLGQQRSRIDELDDTSKRRFRIGSSGHRWSVMGSGGFRAKLDRRGEPAAAHHRSSARRDPRHGCRDCPAEALKCRLGACAFPLPKGWL